MKTSESENALKELNIILDRRVKGHKIDFLEIENLGNIESKIKQCIKSGLDSIPEINKKNAIATTYARAYINRQNSNSVSKKGYTALTQYCRDKEVRPANVKKILQEKDYLNNHYVTQKSIRKDLVFLSFYINTNSDIEEEKHDLIILWNKKFLDNLLKVNKQKAEEYSLNYVYKTPEDVCQNIKKIKSYTKCIFKLCTIDDFKSEDMYYDKYYYGVYSFLNRDVYFETYINDTKDLGKNIKQLFDLIRNALRYTRSKIQNDEKRLLRFEKLTEILTKYMWYFLENYK